MNGPSMKVLILSHNTFGMNNNMAKTLSALFSSFPQAELCQLYIYGSLPETEACSSYFRITDRDCLSSLLHPGRSAGGEIAGLASAGAHSAIVSAGPRPFRRLCRELVWRCAGWDSAELKAWLEREKPSVLFIAPGDAAFLYRMGLTLAEEYSLPLVTYLCDDFYFHRTRFSSLWDTLRYASVRKWYARLCRRSDRLVAISEEYARALEREFSSPVSVLMTGSALPAVRRSRPEAIRTISYFGNISTHRYLSIAEVGRALDDLAARGKSVPTLRVYTGETIPEAEALFRKISSIRPEPYVSGEDFRRAIQEADMLLFTESFQPRDAEAVSFSVSTKIADYLASGIPILAYGPDTVASMRYLRDEHAALCCSETDALAHTLESALRDGEALDSILRSAAQAYSRNHRIGANSEALHELLSSVSQGDGKSMK